MDKYLQTSRAPQALAEERQLTNLWPSGPNRLYSLTLSANHATHKDAFNAYNYVIHNLPEGQFYYTIELSKRGKYHIHGLIKFKYSFSYKNLMASRSTPSQIYPCRYDIHIRYDELDEDHLKNWVKYMQKQSTDIHIGKSIPLMTPIVSCIPIIRIKTMYKTVTIKT